MGYVKGSLQPQEVCETRMVWVPAEGDPGESSEVEAVDLVPPGDRVYFGDAMYTSKPPALLPQVIDNTHELHEPTTVTPVPNVGILLGLVAIIAIIHEFKQLRRREG